jgi:hypothetical protein
VIAPKNSRGAAASKSEGKAMPTTGGDAQARVEALAQFLEESGQYNKAAQLAAVAQFTKLSKRYDKAVQNAEQGLETLYKLATGDHSGMAKSAARELIRILSNTLVQLVVINWPLTTWGRA